MQKKEDVASIRLYPAPYVGGGDDLDDEDKGNQSQTHYYQSKWDDYVQGKCFSGEHIQDTDFQ